MSTADFDVIVVGAGPAGSATAIHLAGSGCRVLLLEKSIMPRDKICGEFLSTEVASMCHTLGVHDAVKKSGARDVRRYRLTAPNGGVHVGYLPGTALSLSRAAFDYVLFLHAAEVGATALAAETVVSIDGRIGGSFVVETDTNHYTAELVVGAYGGRSILDKRLGRPFLTRRSPFVGFKARFDGAFPHEAIELHTFDGGYCGLIADEEGRVNVCWLSHADRLRQAGGSPDEMMEGILRTNNHLAARLDAMRRVGPFSAVGQLWFSRKSVFASDICMVGDAAGMIAPLCGDGMGMALRAAEIVTPNIVKYLEGSISAAAFRRAYARSWRQEFTRRMRYGRWLQAILSRAPSSRLAIHLANVWPRIARRAVVATRG